METVGYLAIVGGIASVVLAVMAISGIRARVGQLFYVGALVVLLFAVALFGVAGAFANTQLMLLALAGIPLSAFLTFLGWRGRSPRKR